MSFPEQRRLFWSDKARLGVALACLAPALTGRCLAAATVPQIFLIERFSTNQVLIHFYTDASRSYELQYLTILGSSTNAGGTGGAPVASWTTFYRALNLPFPFHYIIPDTMEGRQRFYRLQVTP